MFVLVDVILLSFTLQKRTLVKKFFKASTPSPNIFAPYIKNLGMCFAILVYFDYGYMWGGLLEPIKNSAIWKSVL